MNWDLDYGAQTTYKKDEKDNFVKAFMCYIRRCNTINFQKKSQKTESSHNNLHVNDCNK